MSPDLLLTAQRTPRRRHLANCLHSTAALGVKIRLHKF
jgi:hypothetical protein